MTTKNRTILLSIFFLLLFLLILFLLILPNIKGIKVISNEISQTKSRLEEISKRQEEIEKFKKLPSEIKENLLKFENSFVNREIPIDFFKFLEKTAKDLKIQSQVSIMGTPKESFSLQIRGVGFAENVFKFIEKLENSNYLIQIEKIKISKLTEAELKTEEFKGFSKNDLKFEISFSVLTK
jgi:cell division protein FtsI/penicillin-binding protein 2